MKVQITQANLDNCTPGDQYACALAGALTAMGFSEVTVAENHKRRAVVWDKIEGYKIIPLTDEAMQFVDDFDHQEQLAEKLKPMELELPDPYNAECRCGESTDEDLDCEVHDS